MTLLFTLVITSIIAPLVLGALAITIGLGIYRLLQMVFVAYYIGKRKSVKFDNGKIIVRR